ncbi:MAG: transposase [Steroidobacteraceae bacterium]
MDTNLDRGGGEPNAGARKRGAYRLHSLEEKRRVVHECLTSGESVSIVARRHDLNTNQVFHWRKQYERGQLGEALVLSAPPRLLAVRIEEPVAAREPKSVAPEAPRPPQSWIEIECTRPYRVRVHGAVDPGALTKILEVLAGR